MNNRSSPPNTFPYKLHFMLRSICDSSETVFEKQPVTWLPCGSGFKVLDANVFLNDIIPLYFSKQTQMRSFTRQLNLWGFTRITFGEHRGGWCHPDFLRHDSSKLSFIQRTAVKRGSQVNNITKMTDGSLISSEKISVQVQEKSPLPFVDSRVKFVKNHRNISLINQEMAQQELASMFQSSQVFLNQMNKVESLVWNPYTKQPVKVFIMGQTSCQPAIGIEMVSHNIDSSIQTIPDHQSSSASSRDLDKSVVFSRKREGRLVYDEAGLTSTQIQQLAGDIICESPLKKDIFTTFSDQNHDNCIIIDRDIGIGDDHCILSGLLRD